MTSHPFASFQPPQVRRVAVVGAGPSLAYTKHLLTNYPVVIGVNYTFLLTELDYLVVTHFMLCLELSRGEHTPDATLVTSEYASDFGYMGARNPDPGGIRFTPYQDLTCGSSTIIPAIDLATRFSRRVDLFGVDLAKQNGTQYVAGYHTTKTQDDRFFADWARVVAWQIDGLRRTTKAEIVQIR